MMMNASPFTLLLLLVGFLLCSCHSGNCLRKSDCPLGSTCKQGVCRVPPQVQRAAGLASNETTSDEPLDSPTSEQSLILDAGTDAASTLSPSTSE